MMIGKDEAQLIVNTRTDAVIGSDENKYYQFGGGLLILATLSDETCEAHICIPPKLVKNWRSICGDMISFMAMLGFKQCLTNVESSKVSEKLVERLGFEQIAAYNDTKVYRRYL